MAHILVVEESELRLRLLQNALREHKLVCSLDCERGLTVLETMTFDLMVAPIYFERSDVFHFIRTAAHTNPRMRIVLYSTERQKTARYATKPIQSASEQLGVYRYVLLDTADVAKLRHEIEVCLPIECWSETPSAGMVYEL